MTKKIVTLLVLCLMLFSLLAMAFNVQSAKAYDGETSVTIPAGRNVTVEMHGVHLQFDFVITPGLLTANPTSDYPGSGGGPDLGLSEAPPAIYDFLNVWDVQVTARFIGHVKVGLYYGVLTDVPTHVWQTDVTEYGLFVPGDVNRDGKVNFVDLCLIIKAWGSTPSSPRWNQYQYCDLYGDGKINIKDLNIAFQNLGKTSYWTDITRYVDSTNQIIWGVTDHFSLFGVR